MVSRGVAFSMDHFYNNGILEGSTGENTAHAHFVNFLYSQNSGAPCFEALWWFCKFLKNRTDFKIKFIQNNTRASDIISIVQVSTVNIRYARWRFSKFFGDWLMLFRGWTKLTSCILCKPESSATKFQVAENSEEQWVSKEVPYLGAHKSDQPNPH